MGQGAAHEPLRRALRARSRARLEGRIGPRRPRPLLTGPGISGHGPADLRPAPHGAPAPLAALPALAGTPGLSQPAARCIGWAGVDGWGLRRCRKITGVGGSPKQGAARGLVVWENIFKQCVRAGERTRGARTGLAPVFRQIQSPATPREARRGRAAARGCFLRCFCLCCGGKGWPVWDAPCTLGVIALKRFSSTPVFQYTGEESLLALFAGGK